MKRHTLSRSERRDLQGDTGELAEKIASEAYGYNSFLSSSWFDARRKNSGAVIEIKSCLSRLSSGAKGRFRLFKGQHANLLAADRTGSANYVFVLFDLDGKPEAKMVRKSPSEIGQKIGARGGWYASGHDDQGEQFKMPYSAFF